MLYTGIDIATVLCHSEMTIHIHLMHSLHEDEFLIFNLIL